MTNQKYDNSQSFTVKVLVILNGQFIYLNQSNYLFITIAKILKVNIFSSFLFDFYLISFTFDIVQVANVWQVQQMWEMNTFKYH